jgi:hypothetical protein
MSPPAILVRFTFLLIGETALHLFDLGSPALYQRGFLRQVLSSFLAGRRD